MSTNNNRILYSSISYQELKSMSSITISGIYKIENIINHKVYIGQSKDILNRLKTGHLMLNAESNPYLKNAFIKYGFDNFSFEVIKETYDLNYWEVFLIQIYHATDDNYGYNILPGGEGGDSEVTRQSWKNSIIRQRHKIGTDLFWSSSEGIKQKQINSEKQKGSHTTKGKHWYHNGIKNIQCFECPEGFVPGRLGDFTQSEEVKQRKREIERNLTPEQREERSRKLSAAHKGIVFTEERKRHISEAKKGKPGRKQTDNIRNKIAENMKGKKRFTNGIIEVRAYECPEGFVHGTLKKRIEK